MPEHQEPIHAVPAREVLERLGSRAAGLDDDKIRDRRERFGPNSLRQAHRRSSWRILFDQFRSIVIIVLLVAAVAAFATARLAEAIALIAVILVNTLIGFVSEWKATRSMEALRVLGRRTARVRRQGAERVVAAEDLVPGDIVLLAAEDLVPADMRLLEARGLRVNEAALTGESVPADKHVSTLDADTVLAERANTVFKGTTVTEGEAEGVVVATGMQTELGRIAALTEGAEAELTPLEKRLDRLGRRMAWIVIGVAALVAGAGLVAGQPVLLMIETAVALGVAAIPEGLPIVATLALARGMRLMARRNGLVNRLAAVETLGATRIILTDKTGTLTENSMSVRRAITPTGDHELHTGETGNGGPAGTHSSADDPLLHRLLEIVVLCNDAVRDDTDDRFRGDPTEVALLEAGSAFGIERTALLDERPEIRDEPFDPEVMMMATFHRRNATLQVAVKGAPSAVLGACTAVATDDGQREMTDRERQAWAQRVEQLATEGLRVLAVADRTDRQEGLPPYEGLRLIGLVGLLDPPRSDVAAAIRECRRAGMRTVMVTGDQAATAAAIGRQLGIVNEDDPPPMNGRDLGDPEILDARQRQRILDTRIFARVTPEQKLQLVRLFQEAGEVVAMTGDGINDAPGLKKADIGVAMGRRGTDAARQVADMVLRDDRFATIVEAVRHGRIIFANIRKSVLFMLCTNFAEILVVTLASLASAPLPLLPLQILYLNVLTDVFPALALGAGTGRRGIMDEPPRSKDEAILTRHHWLAIGGWSMVIGAGVLAALAIALATLGFGEARAVTVSFLTLGFAKLWFVLNLRGSNAGLIDNDVVRNPWIWAALALCAPLLVAAVYWPPLAGVLGTRPPGPEGWLVILGISVVPALLGTIVPGIRFHTASARPVPA